MMEKKKPDPISDALNLTPLTTTDSVKAIVAQAHDNSAKKRFRVSSF